MTKLLILLMVLLFPVCSFAEDTYLKDNQFLYQVSDRFMDDIYDEEIKKYPKKELEEVMYSDEFKELLVMNTFYYMKMYKINDMTDLYFRKNKLEPVRAIMKKYIFDKISLLVYKNK